MLPRNGTLQPRIGAKGSKSLTAGLNSNVSLKMMERIAIDMDEVMANTMQHFLDRYNGDFDRRLTLTDFHGLDIFDVIEGDHHPHVRQYFQSAEFFSNINVMEGSQETVKDLTKKYDVFVVSAAMDVPKSFSAKFEWLNQYFPFLPPARIVFCGDKSIIAADYLIDDYVRNLVNFPGKGVIFTAHHNVDETRFPRVNNWQEVRGMFLS
jgi:5'(3')-deoxyribonucleotidase